MKIAACFLYCLFTILYMWYPYDSTVYLQLFNMGTLLLFICLTCYFIMARHIPTEKEYIFLQYCVYLSLFRFIYTVYCIYMPNSWVVMHTTLFNVFAGISFAIVILHCALKRS